MYRVFTDIFVGSSHPFFWGIKASASLSLLDPRLNFLNFLNAFPPLPQQEKWVEEAHQKAEPTEKDAALPVRRIFGVWKA